MFLLRRILRHREGHAVDIPWPLVRRVLGYARPHRSKIVRLLALIIIMTLIGLVQPLIFRDLIDNTLPNQDFWMLNILALGLFVIPLVNGFLSIYRTRLSTAIGQGIIYDLRRALFAHMQHLPLRFFTYNRSGELISRLNNDVSDAQSVISASMVDMVSQVIRLVATLAVMFVLDWRLTLVGLALLPIFIPLSHRSSLILRTISRERMEHIATMNTQMSETLSVGGLLLVKLFGQTQPEISRFEERASAVRDIQVQRAVVSREFNVLVSLVGALGTAIVYWVGGLFVLNGTFTIGTIIAFTAYLTTFYSTLYGISNVPISFATAMVSFERVFEVIDIENDIQEKSTAQTLEQVRGEITFEEVAFQYVVNDQLLLTPGQKSPPPEVDYTVTDVQTQARVMALDGVSFSIKPGQLAALVGPSGAGKTTISYLIPRLYDPTQGKICLDGYDLRDLSLQTLSQHIGMVTQETYLFHESIGDNLRYSRPDATLAELEAACRAANIHDFIAALPQSYDTIVGEHGYRLSGGEKQRLALARVILKDPRILVLDEATSHLDTQSESLIQAALQKVMQGRTSVVIAHRLSTILSADVILVMDRGRVVERGTHTELLEQGGLYAELYHTQFAA